MNSSHIMWRDFWWAEAVNSPCLNNATCVREQSSWMRYDPENPARRKTPCLQQQAYWDKIDAGIRADIIACAKVGVPHPLAIHDHAPIIGLIWEREPKNDTAHLRADKGETT